MAKFYSDGIDGLSLSLEEIYQLPEETITDILMAEGEVYKKYHQNELTSQGLVKTGALHDSIDVFPKWSNGYRYVLVFPSGIHGKYNRRLVVKSYKRSKHGRTYTVGGDTKNVLNSDVGFILEVGAPQKGIAPKQWMRIANLKASKEAGQAGERVYDAWLKSKGL